MGTVVVVTTNALSTDDASELLDVAGGEPAAASFHVAVPEHATSASVDAVLNDWEMGVTAGRGGVPKTIADQELNPGEVARHDAQQVLDASLKSLKDTGATATGEVTPRTRWSPSATSSPTTAPTRLW